MLQIFSKLLDVFRGYTFLNYVALGVGLLILNQAVKVKRLKDRHNGTVRARYVRRHKGFLDFYWCSYCGRPVHRKNMEVDHIYPFTANGSNHVWNLTSACHNCNSKKKAKRGLWIVRGYIGKILFENLHIIIITCTIILLTRKYS